MKIIFSGFSALRTPSDPINVRVPAVNAKPYVRALGVNAIVMCPALLFQLRLMDDMPTNKCFILECLFHCVLESVTPEKLKVKAVR